MEAIALTDGGLIYYAPAFLPSDLAEKYFAELRESAPWQQRLGMFGRLQPRLTASYGDSGISYRYSGIDNPALPWTPTLQEIKARLESIGGNYNYCLLNRYRSGADSVGWHADDEPGLGSLIGSVSLGATRMFRIRHNVTREIKTFSARHGTLIIMAGTMQRHWKHEIPKTSDKVGERINLTFREVEIAEKSRKNFS